MGNSLLKADKKEAKGEIDQIAIDYRLKLIAFQDELFQSRKKLQDSDRKMADLQIKLDEYVRNKENQIAEVMFTAHMNAQRIESQTRSQTEYIILEMEEEMRRKQKELELLQKKTNRFVDDNLSDMEGEDIGVRLQVVQDNIRTFREQIETTNISEESPQSGKPVETAKVTELKPEKERVVPARTDDKLPGTLNTVRVADSPVKPVVNIAPEDPKMAQPVRPTEAKADKEPVLQTSESKIPEIPAEPIEVGKSIQIAAETVEAANAEEVRAVKPEYTLAGGQAHTSHAEPPAESTIPKKRRVVAKKPGKTKTNQEQTDWAETDRPLEINDQITLIPAMEEIAEVKAQEPTAGSTDSPFGAELGRIPAASQVESNERMRLDAFVDVRYYQIINGQKNMQHHALQVTIEVEVPPDNYSVRYTKVSSDVVSTLMQYDNVILNEIFPFNIIEPNPQNIALYFFNCLDDMLSLIDLVLHSLVILELPDLQIQVNTRNIKLDNFLHQGVDIFDSIRDTLIPCVETKPDSGSAFKGTISRILKKR
jgi:hypothetical protein